MNRQKKTVLISLALAASCLSLAAGILTAAMASASLKNALGAVYEADPGAARLLADALLSGRHGNGREAAEALGLTSRFFVYLNRRIFGGLWPVILIVLALLPPAAVWLYLRRERARREALAERVDRALAGEAVFYPENEEERLLGKVLSDYAVLKNKTAQQLAEQRIQMENIAHELKTPVAGLLLTLDLAEESGMTPERIARLRGNTEQMQRYIGDLLTLARLRAGKVKFLREEVDLAALLREMAGVMPGVSVEGAETAVISGDRERLWEAFHNLAANALRYGEDGTCRIRISGTDEALQLEVTNRGEGQPSLERYAAGQEDGTSTGLGTAIAGEIVRAHFGTLSAASADGMTTLTAVFPLDRLKKKEAV